MKQQKYIRYILLPTTLLCLIASLFCGCSANSGKISKTGFYFDTMITVTLYGTRDEKILDDCFSLAGNYEKKLSNTITDSEVSKINEANGQFVTVSSDTLSLIKDGIRYGKISDGTFDITIGTLSDLWNFSEIAETAKSDENEVDASVVPSPEQIEAALAHVNYKNIEIKGNQVRLKDPQAKIDLGGIAKGFIADEMRSFLNKKRNHLRRDQPWGKCPDSWEKGRSLFLYHWYPETIFRNRYITWHLKRIRCFGCFFRYL